MNGNTDDGGGMDSLYSEDSGKSSGKGTIDQQQREESANTAIVPLKVLSPDGEPVKEGDEIVVTVKAVHGEDEVEISCSPKEKKSEGDESHDGEMSSNEELDSLSQE